LDGSAAAIPEGRVIEPEGGGTMVNRFTTDWKIPEKTGIIALGFAGIFRSRVGP
jgi:hypothetical protein